MRVGLYISSQDSPSLETMLQRIERTEGEGFHSAWLGQLFDYDSLTLLALAGSQTERIELGTWVVPSHPRHPAALAQQALTVQAATRNRLVLALGLSHRAIIEKRLGLDFGRPVLHMREYLAALCPLLSCERTEIKGEIYRVAMDLRVRGTYAPPLLLAALGPQMLELAGQLTDGAAIWLGSPKYLRELAIPTLRRAAEKAERPAPRIVCGFAIAVSNDPQAARNSARQLVGRSARLPSYQRVLERGGLSDPAEAAIVGSENSVREQLEALAELGVTDLNAVLFAVDGDPDALPRTRELLAGRKPG